MISFKQITLSDKKDIDNSLRGNLFRTCDFCFTNLYAWNARFKTVFSIKDRSIFFRFQDLDGQLYYMMPIGKMPLPKAFDLMMQDAVENKIPFQMKNVSVEMWEIIQKEMPDKFQFLPDRNNYEYLYLSEKLMKLSGKKLQSKRNHINRFKADYTDWEYLPLVSEKERNECIKMLDEWERKSTSAIDISQRYDYIATNLMLENFEYLGLQGGAVRVNGKIAAFTVGEPLTGDTFVVHVEKAFGDMNGAYTIINQQFIEHEAAGFTYINREEDMGLQNLRKAKMSYYPDILLEVGMLIPKV